MGEVQDQGPEQFGCSLSPKDSRLRAKWPEVEESLPRGPKAAGEPGAGFL